MSYSEFIPKHERPVISLLIQLALDGGNTISVYDGAEYVLKLSQSSTAVRSAIGGTGEDQLLIRDSSGERVGWFYLIYNNGSVQDPLIVVCDYSVSDFCDSIYRALCERYGR